MMRTMIEEFRTAFMEKTEERDETRTSRNDFRTPERKLQDEHDANRMESDAAWTECDEAYTGRDALMAAARTLEDEWDAGSTERALART